MGNMGRKRRERGRKGREITRKITENSQACAARKDMLPVFLRIGHMGIYLEDICGDRGIKKSADRDIDSPKQMARDMIELQRAANKLKSRIAREFHISHLYF